MIGTISVDVLNKLLLVVAVDATPQVSGHLLQCVGMAFSRGPARERRHQRGEIHRRNCIEIRISQVCQHPSHALVSGLRMRHEQKFVIAVERDQRAA